MVVVGGGDRHFKMETVQRDGVMCLFKFLSSKNASTKCIFKKKICLKEINSINVEWHFWVTRIACCPGVWSLAIPG
jgi:hypothetical protein